MLERNFCLNSFWGLEQQINIIWRKYWCQRCAGAGVQELTPTGVRVFQQDRSRTRSGFFRLKQEQEWCLIIMFLRFALTICILRNLWQNRSYTGAGVDNFSIIRCHTRSRSRALKHRSGVGVEEIRLRTPLIGAFILARLAKTVCLFKLKLRALGIFYKCFICSTGKIFRLMPTFRQLIPKF